MGNARNVERGPAPDVDYRDDRFDIPLQSGYVCTLSFAGLFPTELHGLEKSLFC